MILSIYTQHVEKHVEYLLRNITLFNERTKRVLQSQGLKRTVKPGRRSAGTA